MPAERKLCRHILIPLSQVSVKPSPAKTNRQAPMSLPVCLIIIIVFFGKIHPFPKRSLAFSVALVQKQIAVWIIKLFRLLPLLEKCGFYNLECSTVEIFAECGTICFYAVQDKIPKEIFLIHRIAVFCIYVSRNYCMVFFRQYIYFFFVFREVGEGFEIGFGCRSPLHLLDSSQK